MTSMAAVYQYFFLLGLLFFSYWLADGQRTYYDSDIGDPYNFLYLQGLRYYNTVIIEESGCMVPYELTNKFNIGLNETRSTSYNRHFNETKFRMLFWLCYDKDIISPVVSMHKITEKLNVTSYDETSQFSKMNFPNDLKSTPEEFYRCSNQLEHFGRILGSREEANKYFNCDNWNGLYFSPTRLVPREDFPFNFLRSFTDLYVNTVPQWHVIKEGNWGRLESSIRNYAVKKQRLLQIRTGTFGYSKLLDSQGNKRQLYLAEKVPKKAAVLVPALIWKLVFDSGDYAGIVFLGVNNPHRKDPMDLFNYDEVICRCVCNSTVGWFEGWNRLNVSKGYIYCCELRDFVYATGMTDIFSDVGLLGRA